MPEKNGNKKSKLEKFTHVCFNLEHVKRVAWEDHESLYLTTDGRPSTREEILEAIADATAKGYDVLPPCDNVDEKGHCKGHAFRTGTIDIFIKCPICGLNLSIWEDRYYTEDESGEVFKDSEIEYECPRQHEFTDEQIADIDKQIEKAQICLTL